MCGFCGIVNYEKNISNDYPIIRNMTNTLSSRGPDEDGLYFDTNVNFGHKRLIVIDPEGRTVSVDGKLVEMSLREYELLKYLVDNENIALSRDKILNNVWNYDYYGDSRTIDSHIKKIRHKLGKKGKYIETMRGVGYKFEVKK